MQTSTDWHRSADHRFDVVTLFQEPLTGCTCINTIITLFQSDKAWLVDLWIESALLISKPPLDRRHFNRETRLVGVFLPVGEGKGYTAAP